MLTAVAFQISISGNYSLLYTSPRSQQSGAIEFSSDCLHMETDLLQFIVFQNFSSIENVCRFNHLLINCLVIEFLNGRMKNKNMLLSELHQTTGTANFPLPQIHPIRCTTQWRVCL